MNYIIDVPVCNIDAIFGSAYPAVRLTIDQKCNLIEDVIRSNAFHQDPSHRLTVYPQRTPAKKYRVEIRMYDDVDGYAYAVTAEKYITSLYAQSVDMMPKFLTGFLRKGYPIDSYRMQINMLSEAITWLVENCKSSDYQVYSKFGYDFTVGFKNTEASTMFKLMFGDSC
jgi:hypothetical protein